MPDRVIVESARSSASLYRLCHGAERMWWRMLTATDAAGRFEADAAILRASCFPLWGERIPLAEITSWRDEWVTADLVTLYPVRARLYGVVLHLTVYQPSRLLKGRIRFPAPPAECPTPNDGRPGGRPSSHHVVEEDTATRAVEVLREPARLARTVRHSRVVRRTSVQSGAPRSTSEQLRSPAITSEQGSARNDGGRSTERAQQKTGVGEVVDLCRAGPEVLDRPPTPHTLEAFVERLSDVYPRPSNLRAVERAIRRLAPDAALQATILAAVEAQKRWPTLARENGRFFPDLDKWVRGEKWRDQPPSLHRGAAPTSTGWTPPVITDSDRAAAQKILASKPTFLTNGSAPRRSPGDRP